MAIERRTAIELRAEGDKKSPRLVGHAAIFNSPSQDLGGFTEIVKPGAFARPLLQAKGLDGFFTAVFGGDAFERKKPDPLPLLKTCEALGSEAGRTLMIGDSSNDAQAARAAGCPVVLVSYGYNHGRPVREVPADAYVGSLTQLPGLTRA